MPTGHEPLTTEIMMSIDVWHVSNETMSPGIGAAANAKPGALTV